MQTQKQTLLPYPNRHPLLIILELVLGYTGYGFLTFSIVLTFAMVIFDYLILFGSQLPSFLDYLPPLSVGASDTPVKLNTDDVTRIYLLLTALFWGLVRVAREVLSLIRRLAGKAPLPEAVPPEMLSIRQLLADFARRIPRRMFWSALPTTAVFFIAFVAMPFSDLVSQDDLLWFYPIFVFFYMIAVVLIVSHIMFDGFAQLILALAQRFLVTGQLGEGDQAA